jgi:hypothetical protein
MSDALLFRRETRKEERTAERRKEKGTKTTLRRLYF